MPLILKGNNRDNLNIYRKVPGMIPPRVDEEMNHTPNNSVS